MSRNVSVKMISDLELFSFKVFLNAYMHTKTRCSLFPTAQQTVALWLHAKEKQKTPPPASICNSVAARFGRERDVPLPSPSKNRLKMRSVQVQGLLAVSCFAVFSRKCRAWIFANMNRREERGVVLRSRFAANLSFVAMMWRRNRQESDNASTWFPSWEDGGTFEVMT